MTHRPFILLYLSILTAGLTGCSQASTPTPQPTPSPTPVYEGTIVAMGDSLTQGFGVAESEAYPAKLEQKLQAAGYNYQVINAGVSGETSSGALSRLEWVLTLEPDIVILTTGGNDGLRGIDPALTEANLRQMIETFQANGQIVVLGGMQTLQNLGEEYTTAFADIYPRLAEEQAVILIPFFLEGVGGVPELNQWDVIHPTAEGYTIIVEHIYPYVVQAIEQAQQAQPPG